MVNEHLSAEEVTRCEQLVQEIAAIVQEKEQSDQLYMQNDQLYMQNDGGHFITLKYGDITVYVYSENIDIQASGSGIKSYQDKLLWTLLQENSVKDRLLERGSEQWLLKVDTAKPNRHNSDEVSAIAARARECLQKARERLTDGDLPQAVTRGWEAADGMARAVALSWGWSYDTPGKFHEVMTRAFALTDEDRIRLLHGRAYMLRVAAETQDTLDLEILREDLRDMSELLDRLELLITGGHGSG